VSPAPPDSPAAGPGQLVEHFFRHEYGRLVAVLVRAFGARHLELAEDAVQEAMRRALQSWGLGRLPDQPAAWLLQVARRLAVDQLRRGRLAEKYLANQPTGAGVENAGEVSAHLAGELGDEPLRLLFLCCHPGIPADSGVALALKTVAGFGTREIAAALLVPEPTVQKRIERARGRLRELALELEPLHHPWMKRRIETVRAAIYLLFNEGYLSARGESPIRHDLCEEALRLARLLGGHPVGEDPETHALAALIAFHAARAASRLDPSGALVLLDEQDRSAWNWELVREGMDWMARSASGDNL
jgi:RNA polymerase sigma-70 factor (ECF subfamily)